MSLRYGNHHFDARHPQFSCPPRKGFLTPYYIYLYLGFQMMFNMRACRLPQVSGQCYTLSTSKHMSILSDHEITTACVSGICYLKKLVIFWCPAWVHMMSDCQTTHISGLLPRFDTLPLHCRYPYPPFPWSAWWRHGIRRINSRWQFFKSWINFL